jgi:hypothetical protein
VIDGEAPLGHDLLELPEASRRYQRHKARRSRCEMASPEQSTPRLHPLKTTVPSLIERQGSTWTGPP